MSKKLIPAIVIAIVAIVIVLLVGKKAPVSTETPVDTSAETATTTPATPVKKPRKPAVVTPVAPAPTTETPAEEPKEEEKEYTPQTILMTVMVGDNITNLSSIEANKGDEVRLTFTADTRNNYRGGLEFRSDVMDPIRLMNGESKMIVFTANESFKFQPYWPGTDTPRPYSIDIVVK